MFFTLLFVGCLEVKREHLKLSSCWTLPNFANLLYIVLNLSMENLPRVQVVLTVQILHEQEKNLAHFFSVSCLVTLKFYLLNSVPLEHLHHMTFTQFLLFPWEIKHHFERRRNNYIQCLLKTGVNTEKGIIFTSGKQLWFGKLANCSISKSFSFL